MDSISYKTVSANKATVNKEWLIIDAKDQVLGRFSSQVASFLRGKHKTNYTPHVDCGDNVIIINAEQIKVSGLKFDSKEYLSYSGYPGGLDVIPFARMMKKHPERILEKAIKGMLPKNRLGREMYRNLHVYVGTNHPHEAQTPKQVDLKSFK